MPQAQLAVAAPLVTVAICAYNPARYIDETLRSVFAQTLQDFEVVIVDDGSTDGSPDRIEREYRDVRISVVRQRHQTLRVARPTAVAHAAGEFIAFLDHDDLWLPDKLERQVSVARAAPDAALVFSDCLIIDAAGNTVGRLSDQYDYSSIDLEGTRAHLELLRLGCFVAYPTAFVRATAVHAIGGFDASYQYVSDYDLWLRLARRYALKCIFDPLAKYRVHDVQFTQRHSDVTLAEHTALLRPVTRSASYPPNVRIAIGHNLFGQHRVAFGLLRRQRRFGPASRALLGSFRHPIPLRDYCHHRLVTSAAGPVVRWALRGMTAAGRRVATVWRARRTAGQPTSGTLAPTLVWIDGSSLGRLQTGYFNLLAELTRQLARMGPSACDLHVVADRRGRAALLDRLGDDGGRIRFHALGWRAVHWSDVYRLLFGWQAQVLVALCAAALLALGTAAHSTAVTSVACLLIAIEALVLADSAGAQLAEAASRPRLAWAARLVRFAWRRLPAPWRSAPAAETIEVLFWRGRFRWRNSRRIAIVQDLTTRLHPELHSAANVSEFDEFLGYVQRHAHHVATVSACSRDDIIDRVAVCPDSVSVIPMPVHPQYHRPRFSRGCVACHGIDAPYVLCVGTLEPRKNLRRLVRAFELLKHEPSARGRLLVLAGHAGWDPEFQRFVADSDVSARTRTIGFVPLDHLPSLYHFASAVIYPSVYEGFGLPVLEAMCSSAVVLASRRSALPEVLGSDGILFDPYDTEDIARALLHVLDLSPEDAEQYRRRCREQAEQHLDRLARENLLARLRTPAASRLRLQPDLP